MARILKFAALFIVVIVVLGVGFARIWAVPDVENHPIATDDETIMRGKYLAAAGDCVSCHTAKGGADFAGGRLLETPFGGIYSSNLTPSKFGIASMTSAEFYQILAYGADDILHPVYPAMPYTSYHLVTRDDADAILSYLMSLPPVDRAKPKNTLSFPYNVRPSLFFWNLLFAERGVFIPDPGKDKVWNRGAYLVRGLGHCGACHTPRNLLGAPERDRALAGAQIGAFDAPDIRTEALRERGWNREFLATFFESGAGPKGTAWGEMFLAVKNSLRYLTHDDRTAIASYLLDVSAADPSHGHTVIATQGNAVAAADKAARVLYLNNCSMCHGPRGKGQEGAAPPLVANSTLAQPDGRNLIEAIANGFPHPAAEPESSPMPAYKDRFSPAQIADLANYLRRSFVAGTTGLPVLTETDVDAVLQ